MMTSSSTTSGANAPSTKPWVEKYRPATLDDILHHKDIVAVFKNALKTNDFPNLLLYGPPGTGKTSSIKALAREMYGSRHDGKVLQLNASDERGINVIRERVKKFAQSISGGGDASLPKLVILDEADSMTTSAQACLRRTMEIYSGSTRFCLMCNYVSRIIEPIASRCSKFRFQPITASLVLSRLEAICQAENIQYTDAKVLEHLISVCDGDLRRAITILQSAHRLAGSDTTLDLKLIHEVSGFVPRTFMNRFIAVCKSKSIERMEECVADLIYEGYTAPQFLTQLHDWLLTESTLTNEGLSRIIPAIALAEHRFCDGSDEYIQLLYVASVVSDTFERFSASQSK